MSLPGIILDGSIRIQKILECLEVRCRCKFKFRREDYIVLQYPTYKFACPVVLFLPMTRKFYGVASTTLLMLSL
jgi:hypothetical protein